jgi:hypothetical protein
MPDEILPEPAAETAPLPAPPGPRWFQRLSSVLFVIFCFELGLFLLIYPWTDAWAENFFSSAVPDTAVSFWQQGWNNPYVRGAVSGLGLVNIWIAIAEVFRLFSPRKAGR